MEGKTSGKSKRKRRNAMQFDEEFLKLQEREEREALAINQPAPQDEGRACAPADYKNIEELIEDPIKEEKERRRKAVEKWTKESNDKFASGLATYGKRFRKLAEPLPEMTVSDCVEHYYMAKPCYFNFEEWRELEDINSKRSLVSSGEENEGTSSNASQTSEDKQKASLLDVYAHTSSAPFEHTPGLGTCEPLEETGKRGLKLSSVKNVVIKINDEPEVVVVE